MAKNDWQRFLAMPFRGRTVVEIAKELGISQEKVKALLGRKLPLPPGAQLVHWLNHLGETHYEVVPPEPVQAKIPPRVFRLLHQPAGEAYVRVFIPDEILDGNGKKAKLIEIFPFYDVHLGHKCCDESLYLRDVQDIALLPNRFALWGGDLMENALATSAKGVAWTEQVSFPREQRLRLEEINRQIAHKTLVGTRGNHEKRTSDATQQDPLWEVAHNLGIAYFAGPVNMEIVWKGYRWTFYITHGVSSSMTPGGKLNASGRPRRFNDFRNFFISGHVHDEMTHKNVRCVRRREFENGKLKRFWREELKEYKIICPSYLKYEGSYAEQALYSPGSNNCVIIQLYANGDYHVISKKRDVEGGEITSCIV